MSIRPSETIQRILISTTSRFYGAFERPRILLSHAWSSPAAPQGTARLEEGPSCRNAFVLSFETEPIERLPGTVIPDRSIGGEILCAYLAVLFGKRFDNHGAFEQNGMFQLPAFGQFSEFCDPRRPQNGHSPRVDFPVPLNLTELERIERLLVGPTIDERVLRTFQGAAKFYLQALQTVEHDPEVAYLHLITCGEILSNFEDYPKEELLDEETAALFRQIRDGLPDGDAIAKKVANRLFQVKRRFLKTILRFVDSAFFTRTEAPELYTALQEVDFARRLGAAYDLRSRYVHTGSPFGGWMGAVRSETQHGRPVLRDEELADRIYLAPTYPGLERIMRYCLLRFLEANGIYRYPTANAQQGVAPDERAPAAPARG